MALAFVFSKSFVNWLGQTARQVLLMGWLAISISGLCEEARGQQIAQASDEFHVSPGQKANEDNDWPRLIVSQPRCLIPIRTVWTASPYFGRSDGT